MVGYNARFVPISDQIFTFDFQVYHPWYGDIRRAQCQLITSLCRTAQRERTSLSTRKDVLELDKKMTIRANVATFTAWRWWRKRQRSVTVQSLSWLDKELITITLDSSPMKWLCFILELIYEVMTRLEAHSLSFMGNALRVEEGIAIVLRGWIRLSLPHHLRGWEKCFDRQRPQFHCRTTSSIRQKVVLKWSLSSRSAHRQCINSISTSPLFVSS